MKSEKTEALIARILTELYDIPLSENNLDKCIEALEKDDKHPDIAHNMLSILRNYRDSIR